MEGSGHLTVQTYIVDGSTLTFLGCCVIVWFFSGDHGRHASLLLPGGLDGVISIWTRTINALKKWRINLQVLTWSSHNTVGLPLPDFVDRVFELGDVHSRSISQLFVDSVTHLGGRHLCSWVFYLTEVNMVCILGKWVVFDRFGSPLRGLLIFSLVLRLSAVKESLICGFVALIRRNRYPFGLATRFSSSKNVVNCVLSVWAAGGESSHEVTLDLLLLRMVSSARSRFPVLVSLEIASIRKRVLEML